MNTFKPGHRQKASCLGFLLLLLCHLALAPPPGPCKHSITQNHLLTLRKLILNQLPSGCRIRYAFTERQHLSDICYVKAAIPQILDLLTTHFYYAPKSDNQRYVTALKEVIYNIYSHKCVPEINEEQEDSPERFLLQFHTTPAEALQKAADVLSIYMTLMVDSKEPIGWRCEEEYAWELSQDVGDEDYPDHSEEHAASSGTPKPTSQSVDSPTPPDIK